MHPENQAVLSRLAELEARFAFQDDQIIHINAQLTEQQSRLRALEDALRRLRSELTSMQAEPATGLDNEPPPPHY